MYVRTNENNGIIKEGEQKSKNVEHFRKWRALYIICTEDFKLLLISLNNESQNNREATVSQEFKVTELELLRWLKNEFMKYSHRDMNDFD